MTTRISVKRSLAEWVDYAQTLHHREIDLSLYRVRAVYQRLHPNKFEPCVITIAGTNGKGSCAEMLAAIYRAAGYRVGKFTSPHLVSFAERYVINGQQVSEQDLIVAFEKIEQARAEISITFFEFGALLAIQLFSVSQVDIAIMEVGLGGRLDAINILDADVSIITSISKDHTAWLGETIEEIAYEKAGIARSVKPCVVGIEQPPQSIVSHCAEIGAILSHIGREFTYYYQPGDVAWVWQSNDRLLKQLPLPFAQTGVQLSNASVCLHAISLLDARLSVSDQAIRDGLTNAQLLGRCQLLSQKPMVVLDVAHNQSSVERLRHFLLNQEYSGRLLAVCGMLKDKDIKKSLAVLRELVDTWHVATIDHERGATSAYLKDQLHEVDVNWTNDKETQVKDLEIHCYANSREAYKAAVLQQETDDCLIVFGSFFVTGDILQLV